MEGASHPDITCLQRIRSLRQFNDEQLVSPTPVAFTPERILFFRNKRRMVLS
jgi:hypothetical protein